MPTKKPILTFVADKDLCDKLTDFRFEHRIDSKSEAIRMLIEAGLRYYENNDWNKPKK